MDYIARRENGQLKRSLLSPRIRIAFVGSGARTNQIKKCIDMLSGEEFYLTVSERGWLARPVDPESFKFEIQTSSLHAFPVKPVECFALCDGELILP